MQTMSQGAQSASLPRFGRRLLLVELAADISEAVLCGVPLASWARASLPESILANIALPIMAALWVAAALRTAYLLRPFFDLVASARQGTKPRGSAADVAYAGLTRAPREVAMVHFSAWAILGGLLAAQSVWLSGERPVVATALFQLVIVPAAGLAALRIQAFESAVAEAHTLVLPRVQEIRVFAQRYRNSLLAIGLAVVGAWQTLLALFARTLAGAPTEALVAGLFAADPVLVLGAAVWWRVLKGGTRPIEEYFDVAVRTKGSKGPSRDEPKSVAAFLAAQQTPYTLATVLALSVGVAGLSACCYVALGGTADGWSVGRLVLLVLLVSLLAAMYETLLQQQILRPLIRHLGSRHSLPLERVRSPVGLRAKLLLSMLAMLVAACAFVWLSSQAPNELGRAVVPLLLAVASVLGIVVLLVRDVVVPLRVLEKRSEEMAKGQLARPVPPWGEADEIGRLAVMFEEMRRSLRDRLRSTESINVDLEREVRRRTEALEQRNSELYEALDKLRRAQDNLVRSEKLASMGRLVAGIAHEINNPVNAVINSLGPLDELIKQIACGEQHSPQEAAKEATEILAVVQRGAARTKAIVQALHGYARGDDSVQREVQLARSVDETLGLLQHRLRKVKVVKDVDPNVRILGFPGQIDQVLMNLLTNAAQAIGDEGGTIHVEASSRDDRVLLEVADDGPGIPKEILPRIFDPFFTTKDVGEGSGLGLSIVHGIVERHGGRIDVHSEPGQGSRFSISFPLPASPRPS
jgi:signal transduction histidine kinase